VAISKLPHRADFAIPYNGSIVLFEFHPVNIRHGWKNNQTAGAIAGSLKHIKSHETKRHLEETLKRELATSYLKERSLILSLSENENIRQADFIVATNELEFFEQTVKSEIKNRIKKRKVLLYFLGGISMAEIGAVRFMNE
jgi:hypothetical protein